MVKYSTSSNTILYNNSKSTYIYDFFSELITLKIYNKYNKKYRYDLELLQHSILISNRRLAKLLLNSTSIVIDELNKLCNDTNTICIDNMSFYSIVYLYKMLSCKDREHLRILMSNKQDLLHQINQHEYIYPLICKFNIQYNYSFSYKFCLFTTAYNSLYIYIDDYNYFHTVNNYLLNTILFESKYTPTMYNYHGLNLYMNIELYMKKLIDYGNTNPILYFMPNCEDGDNNFNMFEFIILLKTKIPINIYYNVIIAMKHMYCNDSFEIKDIKLLAYIDNELSNIITNRIKLSNEYEKYYLRVSTLSDFIVYIISNNIQLSENLVSHIFNHPPYERLSFGEYIDEYEKIKFIADNNITLKIPHNPFHFMKCYNCDCNKIIECLDISCINSDLLKIIKKYNIILTLQNNNKIFSTNKSLYCKIFNIR